MPTRMTCIHRPFSLVTLIALRIFRLLLYYYYVVVFFGTSFLHVTHFRLIWRFTPRCSRLMCSYTWWRNIRFPFDYWWTSCVLLRAYTHIHTFFWSPSIQHISSRKSYFFVHYNLSDDCGDLVSQTNVLMAWVKWYSSLCKVIEEVWRESFRSGE